jgi:hypothetical protein
LDTTHTILLEIYFIIKVQEMGCKRCENTRAAGEKCVSCGAIAFGAGTTATVVARAAMAATTTRIIATIVAGSGGAGIVAGLILIGISAFCAHDD